MLNEDNFPGCKFQNESVTWKISKTNLTSWWGVVPDYENIEWLVDSHLKPSLYHIAPDLPDGITNRYAKLGNQGMWISDLVNPSIALIFLNGKTWLEGKRGGSIVAAAKVNPKYIQKKPFILTEKFLKLPKDTCCTNREIILASWKYSPHQKNIMTQLHKVPAGLELNLPDLRVKYAVRPMPGPQVKIKRTVAWELTPLGAFIDGQIHVLWGDCEGKPVGWEQVRNLNEDIALPRYLVESKRYMNVVKIRLGHSSKYRYFSEPNHLRQFLDTHLKNLLSPAALSL